MSVTVREIAAGVEDERDTLFSARELEVLSLRANGNSYQEVSNLLGISESQVGQYVGRINDKLERAEATIRAAVDFPRRVQRDYAPNNVLVSRPVTLNEDDPELGKIGNLARYVQVQARYSYVGEGELIYVRCDEGGNVPAADVAAAVRQIWDAQGRKLPVQVNCEDRLTQSLEDALGEPVEAFS